MRDKISPKPLHLIMKSLADKADETDGKCLFLLSGDITTSGNPEKYKEFVGGFNDLLLKEHDFSKVHVVPGNHDIERNAVEQGLQYAHMEETWNAISSDKTVLVHDTIRQETLSIDGNASVKVFSLNTCVGCGGKRDLVGDLKSKVLDHYKDSAEGDFDIYEQLDTPAVDFSHLSDLVTSIDRNTHGREIPVILAHHNLLPQREPRLEIYTELINSGSMRGHLSSAEVPLLLCHGHIHDDPIEIITSPNGKGKLIITSAPEIIKGYNSITLFAGSKGYVLGCRIDHYRLQPGGMVTLTGSFQIPFCSLSEFSSKGDERVAACLSVLEYNKAERGKTFMSLLKAKDINHTKKTIRSILEEALWFSLVEIENKNEVDFDDWYIKKVVP